MRTDNQRESSNVEDRRSMSKGTMLAGGGIGAIIMAIIAMLMGVDPSQLLNQQAGPGAEQEAQPLPDDPATQKAVTFVKKVLGSTEDVWNRILPAQAGQPYVEPNLVLFSGQVQSGCGRASAATGPFYCPAPNDQKVYLDMSFFTELSAKFKAPGDFAQAYVIAHEVGHHVQKLLGASDYVNQRRGRVSEAEMNQLSVRLELQADYYAGVWAHHSQKQNRWLEEGDLDEALNAANAIGDDRLQKQGQGYVVPDSFTHGTSAQRIRWFTKGYKSGDIRQGNTFEIPYEQL